MFKKIGIFATALFIIRALSNIFVTSFAKTVRQDDPEIDETLENLEMAQRERAMAVRWNKFYQATLAQDVINYVRETERNERKHL